MAAGVTPPESGRVLIAGVLAFGIIGISWGSIFARLAEDRGGVEPFTMAAWRCAIAALLTLALMGGGRYLRRGRASTSAHGEPFSGRRLLMIIAAGLCLGLHLGAWLWSMADGKISPAGSVLVVTCHPLIVATGGIVLLRERPNRWEILGIALSLCGLLLAVGASLDPDIAAGWEWGGVMGSLVGAFAMAGYLLLGRTLRSEHRDVDNPIGKRGRGGSVGVYVTPVYAIAAVALIVTALVLGEIPLDKPDWAFGDPVMPGWPWEGLLWVTALAVVPMTMGHTVFNWALSRVPARTVSTCYLGETVGATLLQWAVLGEAVSGPFFAGAAMVVTGLTLLIRHSPVVK